MFEIAESGAKLSKEEYEREVEKLRPQLLELQQKMREKKNLAVIILLGGVEGAGKSETMQLLTSWLDPRGVEVNAFGADDEGRGRPPFYRYWMHLPPKGKFGIFFGSWYTKPIIGKALKTLKKAHFLLEIDKINTFERHLSAENVLLLKFWLHISKKDQIKRHKKLLKNPDKAWKVSHLDKKFFKSYDDFYKASEIALSRTDTAEAPWHIIEGIDKNYREIQAVKTILEAVKQRLDKEPPSKPAPMVIPKKVQETALDMLDMKSKTPKAVYEKKLDKLQAEINQLSFEAFSRGLSTAVVFEGWDAAGKGGTIRRLTSALDARNYRVVPIAAPTEEERVKPYLWRFWRHLPTAGRVTIFDRSWYGRVLVERVEGFCREDDWQRAFSEINDFENQLVENGTIVIKYWLHLTQNEQLRRFKEREVTDYKQYKLTEEDWRNREKWNAYLVAADEMFSRTSTSAAPWHLIAANDKLTGRLQVLEHYRNHLKEALKKSTKEKRNVGFDH